MTEHGAGPGWLCPSVALRLDGSERFAGVDATVADFWRWACSDLRDNTTRGMFAEFLVAKAVGDQRPLRIGWDNFDVVAPDGTTIEVKCSAFLQSWAQKRHSELVFGRLTAREFDAARNEYSMDARVRADVFVFAVQTQRDPAAYDVLDISRWQFWVASARTIREQAVKTVASAGCVSTPLDRSPTAGLPMPSTRRRNCIDDGRFNAPAKALTSA